MSFGVLLAIALGGALGSVARHYLSSAIYAATGTATGGGFPWGIFVVNVLGGLVMGLIVELGALKLNYTGETRAFLTTGILGGFTTFSTFSLDSVLLIQRGAYATAVSYMIGSVVLSVLALFCGLWLIRGLYGP